MWSIAEHGVMGFILFYAIKKQNVADDDVIYTHSSIIKLYVASN